MFFLVQSFGPFDEQGNVLFCTVICVVNFLYSYHLYCKLYLFYIKKRLTFLFIKEIK